MKKQIVQEELTEKYHLTARDVNAYAYCPRFVYWKKVRKAKTTPTIKMKLGKQYHKKYLKKAKPKSKTLTETFFEYKELNISTVIDLVEITPDNELYIHEVKYSKIPSKIPIETYLQLITQAVIAEKNLNKKVTKAIITFPAGKTITLPLPIIKEQIVKPILQTIREIIHYEILYPPTNKENKCLDCEFRKICRRA